MAVGQQAASAYTSVPAAAAWETLLGFRPPGASASGEEPNTMSRSRASAGEPTARVRPAAATARQASADVAACSEPAWPDGPAACRDGPAVWRVGAAASRVGTAVWSDAPAG